MSLSPSLWNTMVRRVLALEMILNKELNMKIGDLEKRALVAEEQQKKTNQVLKTLEERVFQLEYDLCPKSDRKSLEEARSAKIAENIKLVQEGDVMLEDIDI